MRFLVVALVAVEVSANANQDCEDFKRRESQRRESLNATVSWDETQSVCKFHCAVSDSFSCMMVPDGVERIMEKAEMGSERAVCNKTMLPSSAEPLLVTLVCPEWKLVMDFRNGGKLGNGTVEIDLFTDHAIKVLSEPLQDSATTELLVLP